MLVLLKHKQFRSFIAALMPLIIGLFLISIPAMTNSDSARIHAQNNHNRETQAQESQTEPTQTQDPKNQDTTVVTGIRKSNNSNSNDVYGYSAAEGSVRVNNLANLEALLNIFANGMEIWGITSVGNFFYGAIGAFILKRPILGGILIAMCPVSFLGGLAAPGIINWIVASARDAQFDAAIGVTGVITALISVVVFMGVGFTPAIIAARRNHEHKWVIFGLTFVSWLVPCGWPALLIWSLWKPKVPPAGETA